MDEKQTENQKESTILGTVNIQVFSDGNVKVMGPINNPAIMFNIFGSAMAAMANHIAKSAEENQDIRSPSIVSMN